MLDDESDFDLEEFGSSFKDDETKEEDTQDWEDKLAQAVQESPPPSGGLLRVPQAPQPAAEEAAGPVRRPVVPFLCVALGVAGLLFIWLGIAPTYTAVAALDVAPVVSYLMTQDLSEASPEYSRVLHTHAALVASPGMLSSLVQYPAVRDLSLLAGAADPLTVLDAGLRAKPASNASLIYVSMSGPDPGAVASVANAAANLYARRAYEEEAAELARRLRTLENERLAAAARLEILQGCRDLFERESSEASPEREALLEKGLGLLIDDLARAGKSSVPLADSFRLKFWQGALGALDREFPATAPASGLLPPSTVPALKEELARLEASRIALEAKIAHMEANPAPSATPWNLLQLRREYVSADPMVKALSASIVQMEQSLAAQDPGKTDATERESLQRTHDALAAKLDEARGKLEAEFDAMVRKEGEETRARASEAPRYELATLRAQEQRVQQALAEHARGAEVAGGGRAVLSRRIEEETTVANKLYLAVRERIEFLDIERRRPPRIRVASLADPPKSPSWDRQIKYSMMVLACALLIGVVWSLASAFSRRPGRR
ncbi:MAG: hypothetical protein V2A58_00885 [Planctomycetota bacterium]